MQPMKVEMTKRIQNRLNSHHKESTIAFFLTYFLTLAVLDFAFRMIFYNVELF